MPAWSRVDRMTDGSLHGLTTDGHDVATTTGVRIQSVRVLRDQPTVMTHKFAIPSTHNDLTSHR